MFLRTSISKIIATLCYICSIKLHSVRMVSLALHSDPQSSYVAQQVSGIFFIQASQYFPKLLAELLVQYLAQARECSW